MSTPGTRTPLPARRESRNESATIHTQYGPIQVVLTVGHYDTQCQVPGEIFFGIENKQHIKNLECQGTELHLAYNALSVVISVALQYGVPIDTICKQLEGMRGEIAGPVSHHPQIRMTASIPDFLARALMILYAQRTDLAHVQETHDEPCVESL